MRFGKKLGRLALPSQWSESTRDTRAHYLGDRKIHPVRWSTQRARAHVVDHGAEVRAQHPGKCTTGHWGPAVSAAALCQGQSLCLGGVRWRTNTNGSQIQRSKPDLQRVVTIRRWPTTYKRVMVWKRVPEWSGNTQEGLAMYESETTRLC